MKRDLLFKAVALITVFLFLAGAASCAKKSKPTKSGSSTSSALSKSDAELSSTESESDESGADTASNTPGESSAINKSSSSGKATAASSVSGGKQTTSSEDDTFNPWAPRTGISPVNAQMTTTLTPEFSWKTDSSANSYIFKLEEQSGGTYKTVVKKSGLTVTKYKHTSALKADTVYKYTVSVLVGNKETVMEGFPIIFHSLVDVKNHPANKGRNYTFKNNISEAVLKNYLSRSMTITIFSEANQYETSHIRLILNSGVKYAGRAGGSWQPSAGEEAKFEKFRSSIDEIHKIDPDVVFEFCIFECVSKNGVGGITIPSWVFTAFGQKAESRNFDMSKMKFENGWKVNEWGADTCVPDITRLETQMFYYYRACRAIDAGFEGIHWGQVHLTGENDTGWKNWTKVIKLVREYAAKNSRRGFILHNAHTNGIVGSDGKLLLDFHAAPCRVYAPASEPEHKPSEGNPQKAYLYVNPPGVSTIYKKSLGGTTYSGWSCSSLPYFVELDNYGGIENSSSLNKPGRAYWPWGYDEISWFANQPLSYQKEWIDYAVKWMKDNDSQGFFKMPGTRTAYIGNAQGYYYAHSKTYDAFGYGLEEAIRDVWTKYR